MGAVDNPGMRPCLGPPARRLAAGRGAIWGLILARNTGKFLVQGLRASIFGLLFGGQGVEVIHHQPLLTSFNLGCAMFGGWACVANDELAAVENCGRFIEIKVVAPAGALDEAVVADL